MGITQSALAQIEMSSKPRKATRQKLAKALGINVAQLI
jgi:transcriptional regulator with XRE-family HTH domain